VLEIKRLGDLDRRAFLFSDYSYVYFTFISSGWVSVKLRPVSAGKTTSALPVKAAPAVPAPAPTAAPMAAPLPPPAMPPIKAPAPAPPPTATADVTFFWGFKVKKF
jgi:hypothetical protein